MMHILDDDACWAARKAQGNLGAHAPECYGPWWEDETSIVEVAGAITAEGIIPSPGMPEGWGVTWV